MLNVPKLDKPLAAALSGSDEGLISPSSSNSPTDLSLRERILAAEAEAQEAKAALQTLQQKLAVAEVDVLKSEKARDSEVRSIQALQNALHAESVARQAFERDYRSVLNSNFWKATRPLRLIAGSIPASMRQFIFRAPKKLRSSSVKEQQPSPAVESDYDLWIKRHDTLTEGHFNVIRKHCEKMTDTPLISIIMPVYNTPEVYLREAIASVRAQIYPNWELCICDDASTAEHVGRILHEASEEEPRIRCIRRDVNGHISLATNDALSLARGEYVAFMDHDDLLRPHSLYMVAMEIMADSKIDMLFTDEDRISDDGRRHTPVFKPGWNPELLLTQNYVCHFSVYKRSLINSLGGMRVGFEGSQDFDLALRASAVIAPGGVRHLPGILYHWRLASGDVASFSQSQLDRCISAARRAITDYLRNRNDTHGDGAWVSAAPAARDWSRVHWPVPDREPKVSIIIPSRDSADLLSRCVAGILHRTDYKNFEVIIADNGSTEPKALALLRLLQADPRVKVFAVPGPFNYSKINNMAVKESDGDILILMNNDIDIIDMFWLQEMVSIVSRPEVGVVGAKLLFGNDTIQHAGVALGVGELDGSAGVAVHYSHGQPRYEPGYLGHNLLPRDVSAVTAACFGVRREIYEDLGGLDEDNLTVAYNDIDFCIRVRSAGLRVVWTPYAELYHLESASRGYDTTPEKIKRFRQEGQYMRRRWGKTLDADPFYNPVFSRLGPMFQLARPSQVTPPWLASNTLK